MALLFLIKFPELQVIEVHLLHLCKYYVPLHCAMVYLTFHLLGNAGCFYFCFSADTKKGSNELWFICLLTMGFIYLWMHRRLKLTFFSPRLHLFVSKNGEIQQGSWNSISPSFFLKINREANIMTETHIEARRAVSRRCYLISSIMGYSLTCQTPLNFREIFGNWWMWIITMEWHRGGGEEMLITYRKTCQAQLGRKKNLLFWLLQLNEENNSTSKPNPKKKKRNLTTHHHLGEKRTFATEVNLLIQVHGTDSIEDHHL